MSNAEIETAVEIAFPNEQIGNDYVILTLEDDSCTVSERDLSPVDARTLRSSWDAIRHPQSIGSLYGMLNDRPVIKFGKLCSSDKRVLRTVSAYFAMRLRNVPHNITDSDILEIGASDESRRFWTNTENYFDLLKLPRERKTNYEVLSILAEMQDLAENMIVDEPFDFLRRLFNTLSPSNIRPYSKQRLCLINNLRLACKRILGPCHPLTVICSTLEQDETSPELSRYALETMSRMSITHFGHDHAVSRKLSDSIIELTRRSGDLPSAIHLAGAALQMNVEAHGPNSNEARSAALEVAHLLTLCREHEKALSLRHRIVTDGSDQEKAMHHDDSIAAHTMEALAEYYVHQGLANVAAMWLRRAETIARKVWSLDSSSTLHIAEKLDALLERVGQDSAVSVA
jgi:hypothetical protein